MVKAMLTKKKLFFPTMLTLIAIAFWIRDRRGTKTFEKKNPELLPMATITQTDNGKKMTTESSSLDFPKLQLPKYNVIDTKWAVIPDITLNIEVDAQWATFPEALAAQASKDKLVILSLVDSGFLDMAANYYITSIHKHHLQNCFLFIALDIAVCHQLQRSLQPLGRVPCFTYGDDPDAKIASRFGSKDFHRKTNSRNRLILEALGLGYTVLNTDVDLCFVSNPLPEVISTCERSGSGCDVAPLRDNSYWNAGFIYVRPTNLSMVMYSEIIVRYQRAKKDDQLILNDVLTDMKQRNLSLNLAGLDANKFACGKLVFGYFRNPTPKKNLDISNRTVIHNNWIFSNDLKILRFKEIGMWHFDEGQYYSNASRNYLKMVNTVGVPFIKGINISLQWIAIRNALAVAILLNRTLILPSVYKQGLEYSMASCLTGNRIQLLQIFDVREDVFLDHPLLPEEIKSSLSEPSFIANRDAPGDDDKLEGVTIHTPSDLDAGPTVQEIQNWYGKESSHVLLINSMCMYRNYQHLNREDIIGSSGYAFFEAFL